MQPQTPSPKPLTLNPAKPDRTRPEPDSKGMPDVTRTPPGGSEPVKPFLDLQIVRLPVVHRLEGMPQHLDLLLRGFRGVCVWGEF